MKLNRKQRRAQRIRRPEPGQRPAQQMQRFLKQPGKFHIVRLPDEKSFVVKVTEQEMPLFLTICAQLNAVLGHCEAIPATPVDAHVANTEEIAQQTAGDTRRLREARLRQAAHDEQVANDALADYMSRGHGSYETVDASNPCANPEPSEVDAAMERHPAGKQRAGGRHRAAEPDTTFDLLAAGADNDEGAKQLAALRIAAAQDQVARAQDELEAANARLREAQDEGGELHNRSVFDKFAEQASQALADQTEETERVPREQEVGIAGGQLGERLNDGKTPHNPQWHMTGPGRFEVSTDQHGIDDNPHVGHKAKCPLCPVEAFALEKADLVRSLTEHVKTHLAGDGGSTLFPNVAPVDEDRID